MGRWPTSHTSRTTPPRDTGRRTGPGPARAGSPGGVATAARRRSPQQRRPERRHWTRRGKIAAWVAAALSAVIVAGSLASWGIYLKLDGNLNVVNAFGGLGNRPPASAAGTENILVLGSQTRNGQRGGKALFGTDPNTNLSDNLIFVHLYKGGTHATVVSIPRDTMVYEPACRSRTGNGTVPAQQQAIIDGAMNLGGPSCAVATVEHLTGLRVDHFIEFDFNSFRTMTDIIGGVEVCLPQAVNDPYSHLHLAAGYHLVKGNTALAFVRTRHGVGNGGDLGRIKLQQEFMASLIKKVLTQHLLENPVELVKIANTATQALTVDPGLDSVPKLLGLATSLRHLKSKNVEFLTMPTYTDPTNTNRLLPEQPQDADLFHMLRAGQYWQGHLSAPKPGKVHVTVLNGGAGAGQAAQAAASLRALGFHVSSVGNAATPVTDATISYSPAQVGAATTLAKELNQYPATQQATTTAALTLTIGPNFQGVHTPAATSTASGARKKHNGSGRSGSTAGGVQQRNGAQGLCAGVPDANPNPGRPG